MIMNIDANIRNDFYHKILITNNPNDCWGWTGGRTTMGYAIMPTHECCSSRAHRVSFELFNQVSLLNKTVVRHTCDNPICCNPRHLLIGTQQDNANDRVNRKRQVVGGSVGSSVLTEKQVLSIRSEYTGKRGDYTRLGKKYRVSYYTISEIVKKITWKHL